MNNQNGRVLTPSVARELIQELFAGRTVERQEIRETVDKVHQERGGELAQSGYHPAHRSLTALKKSGLAENPERGVWYILSSEESSQPAKLSNIKTLEGFIRWTEKFPPGEYVFRGVPNQAYTIQASAYRRPEGEYRDFDRFRQINKELIRDARLRNYDQRNGRELGDLELLAELQHHGAATCLIDFTYSAQIALWFACELERNKDNYPNGKVYAVRKGRHRFTKIVPTLLKKDIDYFLKDEEDAPLYQWEPGHQNNRIIAQQSIFLFGRYEFEAEDHCIIEGSFKESLLETLHRVSNITEESLFPDFEMFARLRSTDAPYRELTASDYRARGDEAGYHRGEYQDAIENYSMAILLDPEDALLYYSRGVANHELHRREKALSDYTEATHKDPSYPDAYAARGLVNYEMERYTEALGDYNRAIEPAPHNEEAYYHRGRVYDQLEEYEEALEDYDIAIELAPHNEEAYYHRGRVYDQLEEYEEALEDYDRAIHKGRNRADVYMDRGKVKAKLERFKEARSDFDTAIAKNSKYAEAYYHRALAKIQLHIHSPARTDLQIALRLAADAGDKKLVNDIKATLSEIDMPLGTRTPL